MRNVGYRIRIRREWVVEFIKKYATLFNTVEVKLSDGIMQDLYPSDFVDFCNMHGIKKVSFHLPKRAFKDSDECAEVCDFIMDMRVATDTTLVTHYYDSSVEAENHAFAISKAAKDKGITVAIENVEVQDVPFYYMDELQLFAMENNFKVCLDIPHLFLSVKRVGLTQRQALEYLIRDDWWKENIVELHLHDFNDKKCHLNLGEGELDFEVLKELLNYFGEECPLIIETTVQDLEIQGVSEVKKVL